MKNNRKGFTLIELLVVIGIIAILFAIVLIAVNPSRQFKQARDATRRNDVRSVLNAVWQYGVDNQGVITDLGTISDCTAGYSVVSDLDTAALASLYIAAIPTEPDDSAQYEICTSTNGRVKVKSDGELAGEISVTR